MQMHDDGALSEPEERADFAAALARCAGAVIDASCPRSGDGLAAAVLVRRARALVDGGVTHILVGACAKSVLLRQGETLLWELTAPSFDPTALQSRVSCLSAWAWGLCDACCDTAPLAWLGALGCVARAGRLPVAWLQDARAKYTAKHLRTCAELVDAAARAPGCPEALEVAIALLDSCDTPRAVNAAGAAHLLWGLRTEVAEARLAVRQAVPCIQGRFAYVPLRTPYAVEDAAAAHWADVLPRHIVLVGNARQEAVHMLWETRCGFAPEDFLRGAGFAPQSPGRSEALMPQQWDALLQHLGVASAEAARAAGS